MYVSICKCISPLGKPSSKTINKKKIVAFGTVLFFLTQHEIGARDAIRKPRDVGRSRVG